MLLYVDWSTNMVQLVMVKISYDSYNYRFRSRRAMKIEKNKSKGFFSLGFVMTMRMKKTFVALSIAVTEYIVAILPSCEAIWLQKLLT